MDNQSIAEYAHQRRQREDGWTPHVMEMFINELIATGSVRKAAHNVDRHVTTAYRTRARVPEFARAWDAARRMAYARLRDEAIERAIDGTPQQVWKDGEWVGMKRVYNDRLLMNLLNHLKHESLPGVMRPRDVEEVEDERGHDAGTQLDRIAAYQPAPVRLRPAPIRLDHTAVNGVALV